MLRARSLISRGWMVHGFGLTGTFNATIMSFECKQLMSHLEKDHKFGKGDVCDLVELLIDDRSSSLSGQTLHVGGV